MIALTVFTSNLKAQKFHRTLPPLRRFPIPISLVQIWFKYNRDDSSRCIVHSTQGWYTNFIKNIKEMWKQKAQVPFSYQLKYLFVLLRMLCLDEYACPIRIRRKKQKKSQSTIYRVIKTTFCSFQFVCFDDYAFQVPSRCDGGHVCCILNEIFVFRKKKTFMQLNWIFGLPDIKETYSYFLYTPWK